MRTADSITYLLADTALGVALIAASPRGVCALEFGDQASTLVAAFVARHPEARGLSDVADAPEPVPHWLRRVRDGLHSVDGSLPGLILHPPDVPLDQPGTPFQKAVWQQLQAIPAGQVVSYRDLAAAIGAPRSVRAVGSACGANQLALLVPCHRALRQDGGLGGYRWGLDRKARLLDWERTTR